MRFVIPAKAGTQRLHDFKAEALYPRHHADDQKNASRPNNHAMPKVQTCHPWLSSG